MSPPTPRPAQLFFLLSTHPKFLTSAPTDQSFLSHVNLRPTDSSWQAFWTPDISLSLTFLTWKSGNSGTFLTGQPCPWQCLANTQEDRYCPGAQNRSLPHRGALACSWAPLAFLVLGGSGFLLLSSLGETMGNHTGHYLQTWEMMGIKE